MRAAEFFRRSTAPLLIRKRRGPRGQILILAVIFIFMFLLIAVALIDIYHVQEARAWGYRVAQAAALAGASGTSSSWIVYQPTIDPTAETPVPGSCIDPIRIELDEAQALAAATAMLQTEMNDRGFVDVPGDYTFEIRVLWQYNGGTEIGWPPGAARLGGGGDWSADNPAVGVYLSFAVHTFMSSIVGRSSVTVHVFAAAEASQPPQCP